MQGPSPLNFRADTGGRLPSFRRDTYKALQSDAAGVGGASAAPLIATSMRELGIQEMIQGDNDIEDEPCARYDDSSPRIVRQTNAGRGFVSVGEITTGANRSSGYPSQS
jgi:hypothetical protein